MTTLRSRRLEALLGGLIDAVDAAAIQSLVATGVDEAFDLDFKAELYGNNDSARRSLAGDVAAMANTGGGLIILGVEEDGQARASATPEVLLSDAEVGRIRQIVASLVAPHVAFDVITVPGSSEGSGFILLVVPQSSAAPHAVLINDGLRYPRRNGATTRYLSEPEVAEAYRGRDRNISRQIDRAVAVETEAIELLRLDEAPWLVVTATPAVPGFFQLDQSAYREFEARVRSQDGWEVSPRSIHFHRVRAARKRLSADGGTDTVEADWVLAQFHTDGAGAYALRLPDMNRRVRRERPDEAKDIHALIDDESLVLALLTGLLRVGQHAHERAAASGEALLRARLVPARTVHGNEIGHSRQFGPESRSKVAIQGDVYPAEGIALIEAISTPSRTLCAVAAQLSNDIAQSFGIPELGQLTADGDIRQRYWSSGVRPRLQTFADSAGVQVVDSVLD